MKKLMVEIAPAHPGERFRGPVSGAAAVTAASPMLAALMDPDYPPQPIPRTYPRVVGATQRGMFGFGLTSERLVAMESPTSLVRVDVPVDQDPEELRERLRDEPGVVEVFADVEITPCRVCARSPARGTHRDVERLLDVAGLRGCGLDGAGVTVAIVDTGVNLAFLAEQGKTPRFDAARSWSPNAAVVPGSAPIGHGTMCAFDVCIAAPRCTLIDIPLLTSRARGGSAMAGLLSDAVRAYNHLLGLLRAPARPGENRSLVVNNSWGMFHPSWDFPPGNPGNYSDNPGHPLNLIVGALAAAGADVLFAAGNCGPDCADERCGDVTTNAIYGANSHRDVITVAGVDTSKERVGYSTIGPGRLEHAKPDISGYTHFQGSGVYAADGGTSAATPVVAGVVAAVRTRRPYIAEDALSHPPAIKALLTGTAEDRAAAGFDFRYGWGVVNPAEIHPKVCPTPPPEVCARSPWQCRPPQHLCRRYPWLGGPDLCRRFPHLCGPGPALATDDGDRDLDAVEAYWLGVAMAHEGMPAAPAAAAAPATPAVSTGCGCGGPRR